FWPLARTGPADPLTNPCLDLRVDALRAIAASSCSSEPTLRAGLRVTPSLVPTRQCEPSRPQDPLEFSQSCFPNYGDCARDQQSLVEEDSRSASRVQRSPVRAERGDRAAAPSEPVKYPRSSVLRLLPL